MIVSSLVALVAIVCLLGGCSNKEGEESGLIGEAGNGSASKSGNSAEVEAPPEVIPELDVRGQIPKVGEFAHVDPRPDGWVTEVVNEAVGKQLEKVKAGHPTVRRATCRNPEWYSRK